MDEKQKNLLDYLTYPLSKEYRSKAPTGVKAIKAATALTPLDSVVEISKELKKEEPDYKKIGLLTAMEAAGLVAPMAKPAMTAIKAGKKGKKVTAYKLFVKGDDDKLYPLFVDADTEVPIGKTLKATFPEYRFQAKNGNFYVPSRGPKKAKGTGDMIEIPDQETRDMLIEAEFLPKGSKAKSIRAVAARPGWHAGDTPTAKHIGPEVKIDGKKYKIRGDNQVWAEVEMPDDIDWQAIANSRAIMKKDGTPNVKTAHITDELPFDGHYRYKTNANMEGEWLISGDMKVVRELDKDEVKKINKAAGREDLPTLKELEEKLGIGLASGGIIGDNMYKGVDDYLMSEMDVGMAKGGTVEEQMTMDLGDVPDNTVGIDPVSGNEIPMGSTAENVRDDIPANLSEGEIVVAADVVNFHGVKLFEDLRAEAKMGYQEMASNGRMGGEPMMSEDDMMGLDLSDLEIMETDPEAVQMNRGGRSMADYAGVTQNRNISTPIPSAPQKTHAEIMASVNNNDDDNDTDYYSPEAISARVQARKGQPKNNLEKLGQAIAMQMAKLFGEDDSMITGPTRVTLDDQPATSDDERSSGTIAEQINFGGDYTDVDEKGTKKKKKTPTERPPRPVKKSKPPKEEDTFSVRYNQDGSFTERFLKNSGLDRFFDEGGMASGGAFDNTGGFDMTEAGEDGAGRTEARMYMNDTGHKIVIMFVDGVAVTPIPDGYFPVGETVDPSTEITPEPGYNSNKSDMGDSDQTGGIPPELMPKPVDYNSLTLDELKTMVDSQNDPKQKAMLVAASAINPLIGMVIRFAMFQTAKQTKAEIERRAEGGDGITNVDKMRYENLLEIVNRDEPNILDMITGKSFEKTVEAIPKPKTVDVDYSDPTMAGSVAAPYTPEVTTPEIATPSGITPEMMQEMDDIIANTDLSKIQNNLPKTGSSNVPTPGIETPEVRGNTRLENDAQRRRDRQEANQNLTGSTAQKTGQAASATRGISTTEKQGGAELDSRFGISGLDKGGIATKKGKKKKSK